MKWNEELQYNITSAEQLAEPLHLTEEEYRSIKRETEVFPMSVSRYYFSLIDPDDPDDPIRRMAIPSGDLDLGDGDLDTSGESSNTRMQGVQHKYAQTVLVLTSSECAMYCRHCFRRRLVGLSDEEKAADPKQAGDYIRSHPEVTNVLLSGGDALINPTEVIAAWLDEMAGIDQLDFIRIGSRTPVTFPQRITSDPELIEVLGRASQKKQIYLITHFNHPKELTPEALRAVSMLRNAGIIVKNQTVLLKGINDDPAVLGRLLRMVTAAGIVQHYIFQCRPVKGVKTRFQVPIREGIRVVNSAMTMQNGLGKSADYTMSHVTGKIRILGTDASGKVVFQYKQAKDPAMIGKIFSLDLEESATWLPDEIPF